MRCQRPQYIQSKYALVRHQSARARGTKAKPYSIATVLSSHNRQSAEHSVKLEPDISSIFKPKHLVQHEAAATAGELGRDNDSDLVPDPEA